MIIASIDLNQYDCPVVRLTEEMEFVKIIVFGVNNSLIKEGIEKIYIKIQSEDPKAVFESIKRIQGYGMVKNLTVLGRKDVEAKAMLLIKKTKAMETTVDLDAMPLAPWVAKNGHEKWTLGFYHRKALNEFLSIVKEHDIVKDVKVKEVPEEVIEKISQAYIPLTSFMEKVDELTPRQLNVLKLSIEEGYYDWPRRSNTIELSKRLGISRVAVTKLLRKAEGTILRESISFIESLKKDDKKRALSLRSRYNGP